MISSSVSRAQGKEFYITSGVSALSICKNVENAGKDDYTAAFICISWISGAIQGAYNTISIDEQKPDYCLPKTGTSIGQYSLIFIKYLKDHPEILHLPAIYTFHKSINSAFPCK